MSDSIPDDLALSEQAETRRIRNIVLDVLREREKSAITEGWVSGTDPLRVSTPNGVVDVVSSSGVQVSPGEKVSLVPTSKGLAIPHAKPDPHQHVEADVTDLGPYSEPGHSHAHADITNPVMEVIGTYVGNAVDTTWIFSSIPQTYDHLRLVGRLSANGATGLHEGRLRFNADSGSNYNYVNWNSSGTTFASTVSTAQDRIYVPIGTTGAIDLLLPNYRASSAITTFQMNAHGIFGTATLTNYSNRFYGGRYENGGNALTDIRLFVVGGPTWETTTKVTLYGLRD